MKHACMVMTLRLSSNLRSGCRQIHRGWKKSASSSHQCQFHVDLFFDIQGIAYKEFLPSGQTVNGKFYCVVLKQLREDIRRKPPDKWKKNNWFLYHNKAPAHTSLVVRQSLTSKNITVIPHARIRLTSHPAIFSYSPTWNYGWRGVVLTRLGRSTQNRKRLSTHSHFRTSRDAWNHEKRAGIAVYMLKGTASKETVETRSYGKKLFYGQIPWIFG